MQAGSVSNFVSVTIKSGTATLMLMNDLPVPVIVQAPVTLTCQATAVATFTFAGPASILPANGGSRTSS